MNDASRNPNMEQMILQGRARGKTEEELAKESKQVLDAFLGEAKRHRMQNVSHKIETVQKGELLVTVQGFVRKTITSDMH